MSATSTNSPPQTAAPIGLSTAVYLKDLKLDEPPVAARPAPVPAAVPSSSPAVEPDVEDYMQQLLGRLRGGPKAPAASSPAPASASPLPGQVQPSAGRPVQPTVPLDQPAQSAPQEPPPPAPVEPLKPEEFVPRAAAPEKNVNLDALRQIANESTRTALDVFVENQKKALYVAQLAGVGGGVTGTALFALLAPGLGWPFYLLAAVCLAGACAAGYKFVRANLMQPSAPKQTS